MSKALSPKRFAQLERVARGYSNHRRIQVLYLLSSRPELDLTSISSACGVKFQTASEHVRRLSVAGLIDKRKKGRQVLHACSPLGRSVLAFLDTVE